MKLRLILLALAAAGALAAWRGNEPAESMASDADPAPSEIQSAAQPAAQPAAPQAEHDGAPMAAEPKSEGEKQSD